MPVAAGSRLGPYEVIAPLGAGGMGEVYRARDPRIGREVAVKILPASFISNDARMSRFTQEARAAGVLNHPNLLTIFDVGTHEQTPFIVSELLDGTTLRERLPLTQRKAIEYALQIARGLAAAHERGIIHRDLKPENVFVTSDDRIKLLDFGLAKLLDEQVDGSRTIERLTDPGMVMGTAAYMSPEQVRGHAIDHRSDIFSFGTLLFETLTGAPPFRRGSQVETMNAILNDDPPFRSGALNPALERIVAHALEKNPSQRFQSMKDVAFALETFSGSGETGVVAPSRARREKKAAEKKPVHFTAVTFRRGFVMTARFARDGSVVYGAAWEDKPLELFASVPGDPHARSLRVQSADVLAVSPTTGELAISLGRRFHRGWVSTGTLARLSLGGGAPRELVEEMQDADWSPDGKQLAIIRMSQDLFQIEYPIGKIIYSTPHWISNVRLSPKGDLVAFLDHKLWGDDGASVAVIDLNGEKKLQSTYWKSTFGIAWAPKGDEVWTSAIGDGSGRDLVSVSLTGKEKIVLAMPGRVSLHDIAKNGDVLISGDQGRREILAGRHGGGEERNLSWCDWSFLTDISADGSRIVFNEQGSAAPPGTEAIYIRNVDGSPAVHLGDGAARTISPDGKWIAAMTGAPDHLDLLPVGAGDPRTVPVRGLEMMVWWEWFPDAKRLLIWGNEPNRGYRLFELALDGDGTVRPIGPEGVKWPIALAPDGQNVIVAGPDDELHIYSTTIDDDRRVPGSRTGDQPLLWGKDGALYAYQFARVRAVIDRIDLATGERKAWQELKPPDPAGVMNIQPVVIAANLESYAYSYRRFLSELHVVKGLL
ncbi:MAG TPA: protein kinase [Thermoanaerobaculia bacterium]